MASESSSVAPSSSSVAPSSGKPELSAHALAVRAARRAAAAAAAEVDAPGLGDNARLFACSTATRCWHVGSHTVELEASDAASSDFDKTGELVWQASVLTAHYIASAPAALRGAAVLELGSGVGLAGLIAARAGAAEVWLTDNEPTVLELLERNAARANAAAAASSSGTGAPLSCVCRVADLSWGSARDHDALAARAGRSQWPILIGADVVYWSEAITPLFDSVARLLAPRGSFILGFTNRRNGLREALEAAASKVGLTWTTVAPLESFLPNPLPQGFDGHVHRMALFLFTWPA